MRHRKKTAKLGRTSEHRNMMLANLVCSLIKERRVTTTLAKARAARPVAEKMVTLGKKGTIHHRRLAAARLHQEDAVRILFSEIAPQQKNRPGGYTRIIKMHQRQGDAAQLAILEWVDIPMPEAEPAPAPADTQESEEAKPKKKAAKKKAAKKKAAPAKAEKAEAAADDSAETKAEADAEPKAEAEEPKAKAEEPKADEKAEGDDADKDKK